MKKLLLSIFLISLVTVGFSGQSWAFGWRGHHHGPNDVDQGSSTNNTNNGSNISSNNSLAPNPGSGGSDPSPDLSTPPAKDFPTAPVPEPMTLSLLGTGIAGIFLKRKIR